jgi:hypothetical protein
MKKPSNIAISGRQFSVKHPTKVDKEGSLGESVGADRIIKVKASQKGELFEDTLLHEVLHSILYVSGVAELLEGNLEEAIVIALENGLSPIYVRRQ